MAGREGIRVLLGLCVASGATAQVTVNVPDPRMPGQVVTQGSHDYGPARPADLDQIVFAPETYQRTHVIVRGTVGPGPTQEYLTLTSGTATVLLVPTEGAASDLHRFRGGAVEVRGVVRFIRKKEYVQGVDLDLIEDPSLPPLPEQSPSLPRVSITVLGLTDRDPRDTSKPATAELVLDEILGSPGDYAGKTVTIRGQFRGRNLFRDLPPGSERTREDWVLKDGDRALWVTGKAPRGKGFSLDPGYEADTLRWLEVAGKAEVVGGIVYLRASKVALVPPPAPPPDDEDSPSN